MQQTSKIMQLFRKENSAMSLSIVQNFNKIKRPFSTATLGENQNVPNRIFFCNFGFVIFMEQAAVFLHWIGSFRVQNLKCRLGPKWVEDGIKWFLMHYYAMLLNLIESVILSEGSDILHQSVSSN